MSRRAAQWISAATALAFALVIGAVILRPILSAEGSTSPDDTPATFETVDSQYAEGNSDEGEVWADDEAYEDDEDDDHDDEDYDEHHDEDDDEHEGDEHDDD